MKVKVYLKASDPLFLEKISEYDIKDQADLERLKELLRRVRLD